MSDDRDFSALTEAVRAEMRQGEVDELQEQLDERMTQRVENGEFGGFTAGSGGERNPGTLPNEEPAERYLPISIPTGPTNYHDFKFGERDIDRYWSAMSAIDEGVLAAHAGYWRHCEQELSHFSSLLFQRNSAVEESWEGDAAQMFRERVNAVRFSMEEWWSAAGWIAGDLEQVAADISWRKDRLFGIWQHYRGMLAWVNNWPDDRAMVIYDPAASGWSPDWPYVVLPTAPGGELGDIEWSEYYDRYFEAPGFHLVPGGRGSYAQGAAEIAERYHERAADIVQPLAEKMVDAHLEIYARTPVQFYGHIAGNSEIPADVLMPDAAMPGMPAMAGMSTPDMSGMAAPSLSGFGAGGLPGVGGGGVPGGIPANLPVMPAGAPDVAGYNPSESPFADQLAQLGQPGGGSLPENGELALMPDGTLPAGLSQQFPSGAGGGTVPGGVSALPPLLGGAAPGGGGAGPRTGFATGQPGGQVPNVSGASVPAGVPSLNGVAGPSGLPNLDGVAGAGGAPGLGTVPGTGGLPGTAGAGGGVGVPDGVPSASGAANGTVAAAPGGAALPGMAGHPGGMGMMPPPMMPPMVPPGAGQPARQGGQAGQNPGAVPPGMPGMFIPPGTVSQRGTNPTAPQPRPATLAGAARTGPRRPGLGRLGGMATAAGQTPARPTAPAAPSDAPPAATGDQEMWEVKKGKGSLRGSAPPPATQPGTPGVATG